MVFFYVVLFVLSWFLPAMFLANVLQKLDTRSCLTRLETLLAGCFGYICTILCVFGILYSFLKKANKNGWWDKPIC